MDERTAKLIEETINRSGEKIITIEEVKKMQKIVSGNTYIFVAQKGECTIIVRLEIIGHGMVCRAKFINW